MSNAPASPAAASKGTLLVVDDDRLVLATVSHGLARAGYTVLDADNGDDAILLARQHRPELALLDIRMEGKSGFDVASYLREFLGTPFMFLSAFADDETLARVKELGAVAYLVKPLDIAQIIPTVDAALSASRSRAQAQAGAPAPATAPAPARASGTAHPVALAPAVAVPGEAQASAYPASVAVATGILMHRFSLTRADALARLERMAQTDKRSLADQAQAMIDALELLIRPGNA